MPSGIWLGWGAEEGSKLPVCVFGTGTRAAHTPVVLVMTWTQLTAPKRSYFPVLNFCFFAGCAEDD